MTWFVPSKWVDLVQSAPEEALALLVGEVAATGELDLGVGDA
jgi:hypothetical protein